MNCSKRPGTQFRSQRYATSNKLLTIRANESQSSYGWATAIPAGIALWCSQQKPYLKTPLPRLAH